MVQEKYLKQDIAGLKTTLRVFRFKFLKKMFPLSKKRLLTLLRSHFGQVGGSTLGSTVIVEFNANPMNSHFPIQVMGGILKVTKNGHTNVEFGELVTSNWREPTVLKCARDSILPNWNPNRRELTLETRSCTPCFLHKTYPRK